MKTFEEFTEERETARRQDLRLGDEGFNPCNHYLGFLLQKGNYVFLEGPRVRAQGLSFIQTANSLCDLVEEHPLEYELNFSEEVPVEEREFLRRIAGIVLEKECYKGKTHSLSQLAAGVRPLAVRAVTEGLGDKYQ